MINRKFPIVHSRNLSALAEFRLLNRVTPLSLTKKFRDQKVSVTCYYICLLSRLSSFTDKFAKVLYFKVSFATFSQWQHLNNSITPTLTPFVKPHQVLPVESRQQSCVIESRQQFFRCSNCDPIFVSETCSKLSQNYSVRVHLLKPYSWLFFVHPFIYLSL